MKEKIHAVSEKDLKGLLESLDLIKDLETNSLSCSSCGGRLSLENIGCIYPFKGEIRVCCNSLKCLERALEEITPLKKIPVGEEST